MIVFVVLNGEMVVTDCLTAFSNIPYNRIAHPILSSLGLESAQTEQYRQSYGHFSVMGWLCFWFEVVLALPSGVCSSCGHAGLTGTNRA